MKKPYQIEAQRAVKQFEAMAADGNPAVQMVLPMAEMVGWLRKGVGELIRQAGLQLMDLLMQEEVRELAGERSQRQPERTASRWGSEQGYCVVMGQKVPIQRPRVRTSEDKEVRLGSYEMFHRGEPLTETVWEKLMLGLSTRKYGQAVREFTEAYGLEKSAVSEHFIEASRAKLKEELLPPCRNPPVSTSRIVNRGRFASWSCPGFRSASAGPRTAKSGCPMHRSMAKFADSPATGGRGISSP